MWTEIPRPKYERLGLRYASDLAGVEWNVICPFPPARTPAGHPRTTAVRCSAPMRDLTDVIASLRMHGAGRDICHAVRIGTNGRLDAIQAAVPPQ